MDIKAVVELIRLKQEQIAKLQAELEEIRSAFMPVATRRVNSRVDGRPTGRKAFEQVLRGSVPLSLAEVCTRAKAIGYAGKETSARLILQRHTDIFKYIDGMYSLA